MMADGSAQAPAKFGGGAWTPTKVELFKENFYEFLRYVRIDSKETGGDTPLLDNIYYAQQRFLDAVWEALAEDIHDIKCLKARQLGISTICKPLVLFWMGVHDGIQGGMIFDTDQHKEAARSDIEDMIEGLPPKFKFPAIKGRNRYGLRLTNRSFLHFMAAGVKNSRSSGVLGRSSGLALIWASEVCSWNNDEGLTSLKSSIAQENPNRLYLWESTARGPGLWKNMVEEAKADDLNQAFVFIGWWCKESQRIGEMSPAFGRYGRDPPTEDEQERIDAVKRLYDYDIDREQLAWYRRFSDPLAKGETDAPDPQDGLIQQDQPYCVVGDTRVGTDRGILRISVVNPGDRTSLGSVVRSMPMGKARIWHARTRLGYEIYGTDNHPLIDVEGSQVELSKSLWRRIRLQSPRFANEQYQETWREGIINHSVEITEDFARLIGLYMGDGGLRGGTNKRGHAVWFFQIMCSGIDRDVVEEVHRLLMTLFGIEAQERHVDGKVGGSTEVRVSSKLIVETFKKLGLTRTDTGKTTRRVHVPEFIWRSPKPVVREFLRGLFEADGFNDAKANRCALFSKWPDFLRDVQLLLLGFGITSRRAMVRKVTGAGRVFTGNQLELRKSEAIRFNEEIGFISERKCSRSFKPALTERFHVVGRPGRPIEFVDEIVETGDTGEDEPVFNLTTDGNHWFDANGIVTHNTEEESFILTGSTFFATERLNFALNINGSKNYKAYKFTPAIDFTSCHIDKARTWRESELRVWEEPKPNHTYVIASDPAFGHSEKNDTSAVEVFDCYADCLEQVAEYRSGSILPHQLAWLIWTLVGWYGSQSGQGVLVIIELNGPGEAVWREVGLTRAIVQHGYLKAVAREKGLTNIFQNARQYVYGRSDAMNPGHNYHWKTTPQLKVAAMERLRDYLHQNAIILRSADLITEMRDITRDGDTIQAEGHGKDDRTYTCAMAVRGYEEKLRRGLISRNATKQASVAAERLSMHDQTALYNQFHLEMFFKSKSNARMLSRVAEQHYRRGY